MGKDFHLRINANVAWTSQKKCYMNIENQQSIAV